MRQANVIHPHFAYEKTEILGSFPWVRWQVFLCRSSTPCAIYLPHGTRSQHGVEQGGSTVVLLTFWAGPIFVMGDAVCTAGCLAHMDTQLPGSVLQGPLEESVFSWEHVVFSKPIPQSILLMHRGKRSGFAAGPEVRLFWCFVWVTGQGGSLGPNLPNQSLLDK